MREHQRLSLGELARLDPNQLLRRGLANVLNNLDPGVQQTGSYLNKDVLD